MLEAEAFAAADGLLLPIGTRGSIHSVHADYINMQSEKGLIALVRQGREHIPFGIEAEIRGNWLGLGLEPQQPVAFEEDSIVLGKMLKVTAIRECPRFSCQVQFTAGWQDTGEQLRRLEQICRQESMRGGMAAYLEDYTAERMLMLPADELEEHMVRSVWQLVQGIAGQDMRKLGYGIQGLLGAGPGSTPSGDDFLLGGLSALRCLRLSGCREAQNFMIEEIRQMAPAATTHLSVAYLHYGMQGQYHQRIKEFMEALGTTSRENAAEHVRGILELGHSSGVDFLLGFVYGGTAALAAEAAQKTIEMKGVSK